MEFHDVVRKPRMVRAFEPTPLHREVVERILATAQRGPSAGFTQGFEFLVFDGPDQTARFWDYQTSRGQVPASRGAAVRAAPLLIVPLAHAQA